MLNQNKETIQINVNKELLGIVHEILDVFSNENYNRVHIYIDDDSDVVTIGLDKYKKASVGPIYNNSYKLYEFARNHITDIQINEVDDVRP